MDSSDSSRTPVKNSSVQRSWSIAPNMKKLSYLRAGPRALRTVISPAFSVLAALGMPRGEEIGLIEWQPHMKRRYG